MCVVRGQLDVNYSLHILTDKEHPSPILHGNWKCACYQESTSERSFLLVSEKIVELDIQRMKSLKSFCHVSESPSPQWVVSSCAHIAGAGFTSQGSPLLHCRSCVLERTHTLQQLAQRVHALVTQVLRAGVWTTGLHLAQRKLLERDMFCLHVLLYALCVPVAKQVSCRMCKCLSSSIYSLQWASLNLQQHTLTSFFQCLFTHKGKGRFT